MLRTREPGGDLILGHIGVLILQVNQHLEGYHGYTEFLLVLAQQFLRIVWPVKRLAARIRAGTCMVTSYNKMATAVVFPDNRMPKGFARSTHAHRQRQQRKLDGILGILGEKRLVTSHSDVVLDVARFRHPDGGVNEEVRSFLFCGPQGQLLVSAVHRIACLEGNYAAPPKPSEFRPEF
jgi:hypothetical protein